MPKAKEKRLKMNEHDEKCENGNRKKGDGSGNKRSTGGAGNFLVSTAARRAKGNIESEH